MEDADAGMIRQLRIQFSAHPAAEDDHRLLPGVQFGESGGTDPEP